MPTPPKTYAELIEAHERAHRSGHTVWIAGVLFSLLAAYRRGEQRGDW